MNPNVRLIASLISLAALGGCYVQSGPLPPSSAPASYASYDGEYEDTEEAPPAPPPPPVEVIPPAPSPAHVWIEGHFGWRAHAYTWERGRYEQRPRDRANWVPAHWERRGHRRVWVNGHWG
jgi:hypothetical protein